MTVSPQKKAVTMARKFAHEHELDIRLHALKQAFPLLFKRPLFGEPESPYQRTGLYIIPIPKGTGARRRK